MYVRTLKSPNHNYCCCGCQFSWFIIVNQPLYCGRDKDASQTTNQFICDTVGLSSHSVKSVTLKIELLTARVGLSSLPLQLSCRSCMSADLGLDDSCRLSEEPGCCSLLGRAVLMVLQYCFSDSCGLKGLWDQGEKNRVFFLKSLSRSLKGTEKRKQEKGAGKGRLTHVL